VYIVGIISKENAMGTETCEYNIDGEHHSERIDVYHVQDNSLSDGSMFIIAASGWQ
jgi:hypothetical protein